jgi:hypothetical protein
VKSKARFLVYERVEDLSDSERHVSDILCSKYARLVSYVSQYKQPFCDNRHIFMVQNWRMSFVVNSNSSQFSF